MGYVAESAGESGQRVGGSVDRSTSSKHKPSILISSSIGRSLGMQ